MEIPLEERELAENVFYSLLRYDLDFGTLTTFDPGPGAEECFEEYYEVLMELSKKCDKAFLNYLEDVHFRYLLFIEKK